MSMVATPLRVVLLAAWALSVAQAATVFLVDSAPNTVLRHVDNIHLDTKTLTFVDAALLRLQPPFQLHGSASSQVGNLFSSVVKVDSQQKFLEHPTAFLFVNLFGLQQEGRKTLPAALKDSKFLVVDLADAGGLSILEAQRELAVHNPDIEFHHLDRFSSQDCDDFCLLEALKGLLPTIDGEYTETSALDGVLKVGSVELDLKSSSARLFAIELALFYRSAKTSLATTQALQDILVMDVVFSDLGSLVEDAGPAAAEAAVSAVVKVVGWIRGQYEAQKRGHFAYQVALLDKADEADLSNLMRVRPDSVPARRLQGKAPAPFDEKKAVEKFSNHAAIFGAAFLLVYFTYAGIYCLTSMQFKQDTLLYSKGKVD